MKEKCDRHHEDRKGRKKQQKPSNIRRIAKIRWNRERGEAWRARLRTPFRPKGSKGGNHGKKKKKRGGEKRLYFPVRKIGHTSKQKTSGGGAGGPGGNVLAERGGVGVWRPTNPGRKGLMGNIKKIEGRSKTRTIQKGGVGG